MPLTTRALGFTNGIQRLIWSGPPGTITAHLWGGGGGRGGSDSYPGGSGTGGGYSTYQYVANDGDILDVAVGGAGANGQSGRGGAAGGSAGASYGLLLFNTRTTPATPPVYPVFDSWYSSFLNTNGVWEQYNASSFSRTYTVNFPVSGDYTFTFGVDNYGAVFLDGSLVIERTGEYDYRNWNSSYQTTRYVNAGNHTLLIQAVNTGWVGAVGVTIGRTVGLSGGRGGNAGPAGSSGAGGGGGGATALLINNTVVAAAGGGSGGGGGGRLTSGQTAPGSAGINAAFNGQNGQDHPGDGGGGGGGGGGWQSGNGGACGDGDTGGRAGSFGLSSAPGEAPTGTLPGGRNSTYYKSGIAQGANAGQSATGGYAVIEIETTGTNINAGGTYFPVKNVYVKDGGIWKEAQTIWVKDGGIWKSVSGGIPPLFNSIPNTIGVNSRPY